MASSFSSLGRIAGNFPEGSEKETKSEFRKSSNSTPVGWRTEEIIFLNLLALSLLREFWGICRWKHKLVFVLLCFLPCINRKSGAALILDSKGWGLVNSISYPMSFPPNTHPKAFPDFLAWWKHPTKDFHSRLCTHKMRTGSVSVPCGSAVGTHHHSVIWNLWWHLCCKHMKYRKNNVPTNSTAINSLSNRAQKKRRR